MPISKIPAYADPPMPREVEGRRTCQRESGYSDKHQPEGEVQQQLDDLITVVPDVGQPEGCPYERATDRQGRANRVAEPKGKQIAACRDHQDAEEAHHDRGQRYPANRLLEEGYRENDHHNGPSVV